MGRVLGNVLLKLLTDDGLRILNIPGVSGLWTDTCLCESNGDRLLSGLFSYPVFLNLTVCTGK